MMILEMKIVLRVLVTMMKFRTRLHKDNCNVFSGIKFVQFNTFISKQTRFSSCVCYLSHQAL